MIGIQNSPDCIFLGFCLVIQDTSLKRSSNLKSKLLLQLVVYQTIIRLDFWCGINSINKCVENIFVKHELQSNVSVSIYCRSKSQIISRY